MARWVASRTDSTLISALSAATVVDVVAMLPEGPTIVVVPTSRQRPFILRSWLQRHQRGEVPLVMTMAQFVRRLGGQLIPNGPRILHESAVSVLLRHAAAQHPSVLSLGLSAETMVRWSQHDLRPDDLDGADDAPETAARAVRIRRQAADVWRALQHSYGSRGCDRGTYAQILARELPSLHEPGYQHADGTLIRRLIMLDTHGVTPVDREILRRLAEGGWDIGIHFCDEPDVSEVDLPRSTTDSDIQVLVTHGWRAGGANRSQVPHDVVIATAPTRVDEVRTALMMIRREVESGRPMHDVCICLPGSKEYRRILHQQAALYGVPLDMSVQRSVTTTRIGAAVASACQVITGGWQRIDLRRMLAEPLFERLRAMGAADLLEIAARDRIRGGSGAEEWRNRLEWGAQATLAAKQRAASEGADDVWSRDRDVRAYERAITLVQRLEQTLAAEAAGVMSGADFATVVAESIISRLELDEALERIAAVDRSIGAVAADIEIEAFGRIRESLTLYSSLSQDHELLPLTFSEHMYAWWGMVEQLTIDVGAHSGGVAVMGPAELRSRRFALVLVLGFVEGEFPRTKGSFFDEELLPQLVRRLDVEAMADCRNAAAEGQLVLLRPKTIDDTITITSSFAVLVPEARYEQTPAVPTVSRYNGVHDSAPYRTSQNVVLTVARQQDEPEELVLERSRRMSASRFDAMTSCPFAYMATKVMRLDSTQTDDARLTPLERGNVLHELIAEFFNRIAPQQPLTSVTRDELLSRRVVLVRSNVESYWSILCQLVDEYSERHAWTHTYAVAERQALLGSPGNAGLLRRWLELEIEYQQETGFAPALFELTLQEDLAIEDQAGGSVLAITARIDRIDLRDSGEGIEFIVNDYKPRAGSFSMITVFTAQHSQMPLYIKATSTWLARHGVVATPLAAIYRSFGASIQQVDDPQNKVVLFDQRFKMSGKSASMKFAQIPKKFADLQSDALSVQVDRILPQLLPLYEQITTGCFPVLPAKDACAPCRMSEFCRVRQWGEAIIEPESHHP